MQKIWFSIYDFSFDYKGTENAFIDDGNFDWAKELVANTDKILDELKLYIASNNLQSYFNTSMVSKKNSWKTVSLRTWDVQLFKNQQHFPFTTSLINKYPQIVSASFNLLEPKSKIVPHCGDTNAIYRCHLGLEIPSGLPDCGFKVKTEVRAWEKGKWLIFMDAYNHEAWNNTNKERYIFLIDVVRDEFLTKKKFVCATVLTSLFLQKRAENYKFTLYTKPVIVTSMTKILRPFAQFSAYLINKLKVY
ncbi:MAG TPA: aspartyl/asparaginyl beta-hydroxylase domain-containing protein [Bacteroidia bacterium]|nr:aspartyl/asparaginyl beta-hydroxylase domain-containing protein [Bacteroidia bacterium]